MGNLGYNWYITKQTRFCFVLLLWWFGSSSWPSVSELRRTIHMQQNVISAQTITKPLFRSQILAVNLFFMIFMWALILEVKIKLEIKDKVKNEHHYSPYNNFEQNWAGKKVLYFRFVIDPLTISECNQRHCA